MDIHTETEVPAEELPQQDVAADSIVVRPLSCPQEVAEWVDPTGEFRKIGVLKVA